MSNTVIGSSMVIDGEISGDARLVVQGKVKGRVAVKQGVVVERSGVLEAEIETDAVEIAGSVTGKVTAGSRVEITPEGRMIGDIRSPRILIADGAQFKGNVDMDQGS